MDSAKPYAKKILGTGKQISLSSSFGTLHANAIALSAISWWRWTMPVGRVGEQQRGGAGLQPQRGQAMPPPRGFGGEFRIAGRAGGAGERKPVAAALGKIVEQDAAGIVLLRHRKADLQRARAVGGN